MKAQVQRRISFQWQKWVKRIPAHTSIELNQRSIFILPSRVGLIFVVALMALFVGGINYVNSLILALTFYLTGLMLVVILQTYRNLTGITFSSKPAEPGFVGDFVMYTITLKSDKQYVHEGISVTIQGDSPRLCAVEIGQETQINVYVPAIKRGIQRPGRLLIETTFPLGIVRAWSWVDLELQGLVYPKPLEGPQPLSDMVVDENSYSQSMAGADDFAGLNPYQSGDPLSRVYWKVLARGLPLATKSFEQPVSEACWLGFMAAPGDLEHKLSVLTYWVLRLSKTHVPFGLDLPQQKIAVDRGRDHKKRCLEALALFDADLSNQNRGERLADAT